MDTPDPATLAGHEAELDLIAGALDERYQTRLIEPNEQLPVPTLLVAFDSDDEGRERTLGLSFMPFGEGDFTSTGFLQFYVRLPFDVPDERRGDVERAATIVNAAVAIGHFAVRGSEAYYRYVLATPSDQVVDGGLVNELVTLIDFHQERFADYLEGVATGNVDLSVLPAVLEATLT